MNYRAIGKRFFILDYQITDYITAFQIAHFHKAFTIDKVRVAVRRNNAVTFFKQDFTSWSAFNLYVAPFAPRRGADTEI